MTNSIKADLERVVTTVEQVKGAGNQIMDGVTVVRELEDENRQSSTTVVQGMSELTQNNNVLHDKTMSSMDMTTNINEQVERMASLMEQMVTLMNESADHANESSGELSRVAETTMLMAKLSDEVETLSLIHIFRTFIRRTARKRSKCRSTPQTCTGMCNGDEHIAKCRWYGGAASLDEIIPCRELLVCIRDLGSCTDGRILCCCDRSNDYLLVRIL